MSIEILGIEFFDTSECGELMDLPPETVRRCIKNGDLMAYRFDGRWYIPWPVISGFLSVKSERRKVKSDRQKIRGEASKLKKILDDFLKKGDVSQDYYDEALDRFADLLPE